MIRVPVTPHSLLLENQPIVHRSGQSSPKHGQTNKDSLSNEKLLAAVSLSTEPSINEIILNTPIASNHYEDHPATLPDRSNTIEDPLLGDEYDYNGVGGRSRPHSISGQNMDLRDLTCSGSGSDCDISWIFLLVCILVLCFAIPLIYVFYIAEQEEIHRHEHHDVHNQSHLN